MTDKCKTTLYGETIVDGIRVTFVSANDEIPDDVVAQSVKGDSGTMWKSGIFSIMQEVETGDEKHIYITSVCRADDPEFHLPNARRSSVDQWRGL
jgi:hypothetical protein